MSKDDVQAFLFVIALCCLAWLVHDVLPQTMPADFRQTESGARL